jgi:SNF2 family DNA or RNA helicase
MRYETRRVEMSPVQEEAYRAACSSLLREKVDLFAPGGVASLTVLSLLAAGRGEASDGSDVAIKEFGASPSAKTTAIYQVINEWDGRPMAVFTISQQVLMTLERVFRNRKLRNRVAYVSAEHRLEHRTRALQTFSRAERPILLTSTKTIGIGVDLSRAETAVFLQPTWSLGESRWVESKLSPDCTVITYVTTGTVEVHQHLGVSRLREIVTRKNLKDFLYGRELKE